MNEIIQETNNGRLLISLNNEMYEKEAVMAAAYKMTNLCTILFLPGENKQLSIVFEPLGEQTNEDLEKIAKDFCREVLDQQIRLDLEKRFGNIRELIVKHAFSPLEDLKGAISKK